MTPKSFIGKFLLCLCIEKDKLWLVALEALDEVCHSLLHCARTVFKIHKAS